MLNLYYSCKMHPSKKCPLSSFAALMLMTTLFMFSCKEKPEAAKPVDPTVTEQNAYVKLFMDSVVLLDFISSESLNTQDSIEMLSFYRNRNFQFAWWDSSGITEQVPNFINLYRNYAAVTGDSSVLNRRLDSLYNAMATDSLKLLTIDSTQADLLLTRQFLRYVERAYAANENLDMKDLDWFIPKKQFEPIKILENVLGAKTVDEMALALPVNQQFKALMGALKAYQQIEADANANLEIVFENNKIVEGDSAAVIRLLKAKLHALGDLKITDTTSIYDSITVAAVKQFQDRMGLSPDGVIGVGTQQALNTPIRYWVQQLLINLERARWLPVEQGRKFLFVNIPSFTLYVFDSNRVQFTMGVVVGTTAHNTTIFSGNLKYVVMAPYWNVPYSIVKNEMGRSNAYFAKRNMEIVGRYKDGLPMVRQKPGPNNALGKVKFLFPNSYSIYLHDTPSKSAFDQSNRAFSHGCIRLSNPQKLAYYFLDGYKGYSKQKIDEAMNGKKETTVTIDEEIPVLIAYLTAFVDPVTGQVNFRKDIYGHDGKMAERMFGSYAKK